MRKRIKLFAGVVLAVSATGILGSAFITRVAISQEPKSRFRQQPPVYAPQSRSDPREPNGFFEGQIPQVHLEESEEMQAESQRLETLLENLRNPDASESQEQARQELTELLSGQLDRDLQQREVALVAIEERAKELRKQLELRRSNKEKTIEMLLMIAENPTAGLGIPEQWMRMLAPSKSSPQYPAPLAPAVPTYSNGPRYYPSTGSSYSNSPSPPMFNPVDDNPQTSADELRISPTPNRRQ